MQHLLLLDIGHRTIFVDTILLPHRNRPPHLTILQDRQDNYTIKYFIPHDLVLVLTWDIVRYVAFKGTRLKDAPHSSLSLNKHSFPKATIPPIGSHRLILQPTLNLAILQAI